MKVVFMGTPDFAAASLRALAQWPGAEVLAVYCQPDRPAGRGQNLQIGPVKKLAQEQGIPVRQPVNFKNVEDIEALKALGADILVVAAYGLILPQAVLDAAPLGAINVHASLLPQYRGAAPIQRAVMNGDARTGITIMQVRLKLDSGPMLMQRALGIGFEQTAGELHDELAELGGKLLVETLERLEQGRVTPVEQDEARTSYAAKLTKEDGFLNFESTAREAHNRSRGVTPWPGAQVTLLRTDAAGKAMEPLSVLVQKGKALEGPDDKAIAAVNRPGAVLPSRQGLIPIVCADGLYGLSQLKPSGGKSMDAAAFANGYLKNFTTRAQLPGDGDAAK